MSITETKRAIMKLSPEELARFREWFEEYCAEISDEQIERDAKSGRLSQLLMEANDEALIKERDKEPGPPLREYLKEKKKN